MPKAVKSLYASDTVQKRLIKAVNVLYQHAGCKLPEGYEIRVSFMQGYCSLELRDPNGDDVVILTDQASTFDEACVAAIEDLSENARVIQEMEAGGEE